MIEDIEINMDGILLYAVNDNAANMKLGIRLSGNLIQYFCDMHTLQLELIGRCWRVLLKS